MFDDSPKRFDRIVSILIQLQSKRIVKAQELADRFDVSLRTIYRDIRSLETAGVPVYGEAGTGYALVDGYRLPPVMFTREEATSFITAEKLMQKFTDKELGEHYASAMFKLKSILRSDEKELVSEIESRVLIREHDRHPQKAPNAMATVLRAISSRQIIRMSYEGIAATVPSEREIEPVGIFHDNQHWYIMGYCHLRKAYRQFRTDRIHDIRLTEKEFTKAHPSLESFLQPNQHLTTKVRVLVDKDIVKYIRHDRRHYGFVSEEEKADAVEMTFMCRDLNDGFARWFLMFADYATVIEPVELKTRLSDLMEKARQRLY